MAMTMTSGISACDEREDRSCARRHEIKLHFVHGFTPGILYKGSNNARRRKEWIERFEAQIDSPSGQGYRHSANSTHGNRLRCQNERLWSVEKKERLIQEGQNEANARQNRPSKLTDKREKERREGIQEKKRDGFKTSRSLALISKLLPD